MKDKELYDRLVARVQIDERGCWIWQGPWRKKARHPSHHYGYIAMFDPRAGRRRSVNTHRAMWIAMHGLPAEGMQVCHRCDVPKCINPAHLFLGTNRDNVLDCHSKGRHSNGRSRTHCKRGHEYSAENTLYVSSPSRPGGPIIQRRQCKTCNRRRLRIKAGWPEDVAANEPTVSHGHRVVNARWHR